MMSISRTRAVPCPVCRREARIAAVSSVDADRRPDLRDAILDGSLQRQICPDCGTSFRRPPDLCYIDRTREQWIAAFQRERMGQWRQLEVHAASLLEKTCGPAGRGALSARITFGWEALREKLLLAKLGLQDVTLELCKLDLTGAVPPAQLPAGTELRLLRVEGDTLVFAQIEGELEQVVGQLQVRRARYDELAGPGEHWAVWRQQLSAGPFVDMQRLATQGA
jgi:hypothetical protein